MTDLEATNAILAKWIAEWPALSVAIVPAGVPYVFENNPVQEYAPPTYWAELIIEHGTPVRETLGKPARYRCPGMIYIALRKPAAGFGNVADGTKDLLQLGEAVAQIYHTKQFNEGPDEDGVITREAAIRKPGDDGLWWILAVLIPFDYYQVR